MEDFYVVLALIIPSTFLVSMPYGDDLRNFKKKLLDPVIKEKEKLADQLSEIREKYGV